MLSWLMQSACILAILLQLGGAQATFGLTPAMPRFKINNAGTTVDVTDYALVVNDGTAPGRRLSDDEDDLRIYNGTQAVLVWFSPPKAPTGVSATLTANTKNVTVSWTRESGKATGYVIERQPSGGSWVRSDNNCVYCHVVFRHIPS